MNRDVSIKRKAIQGACLTLFATMFPLWAVADSSDEVTFDDSFLKSMTGIKIDVSRFSKENPIDPGDYVLDVYLNGNQVGREKIRVASEQGKAKVCFSDSLLKKLALKSNEIPKEKIEAVKSGTGCVALNELLDDSNAQIDTADMRMNIAIPQAHLIRNARGFVDPTLWDQGENALSLRYNVNGYRSVTNHQSYESLYAKALVGFNFMGWMFRHDGSFNWHKQKQSSAYHHYENVNTYVQKDIPLLKSRLTLGEGNTSGELFDTLSFRGVQMATVEQMWPDSQRGYAPEIRGVASSNALVSIKQNGVKIYETTVSPGAFLIDDLYPTGYGGDLDVTVKEADGSEKHFSVPYAAVAKLKRPGMTYYTAMAGVSRIDNLVYTPKIYQATIQHGLSNTLSVYSGILGSGNYFSALLGGAVGLPIGAFSADVTGARTRYGNNENEGLSFRATYSKKIAESNTSISIATYRFSSSGYYSYSDAIHINNYVKKHSDEEYSLSRPKDRFSVTANQRLGDTYGNLYLTGYVQDYWDKDGTNTQYQMGYNNTLGRVSYSLAANRLHYSTGSSETQFTLDFSVPLGNSMSGSKHYLNGSATQTKDGLSAQTAVNGTVGEYNQYTYNVGVSKDTENKYSGNVSGQYRSPYSALQLAYSHGEGYHSISGGASGSMVALPDSLTFSAYQSNTLAVVSADNAAGAHVVGYPNITLDGSGNAIVPNLNPYRLNELAIDPKGLPMDVEMEYTSQRVVPIEGSVVKVKYKTSTGRPILIRASLSDGNALPFGAKVSDENGNTLTTVTQGGQIYTRLNQDIPKLLVSWGSREENSCVVNLENGKIQDFDNGTLARLSTKCHAEKDTHNRYVATLESASSPQG
ncbi:fimbrial biogenesis outer membrane usher protein [Erwinia endophytica]|uniref:fimbria/pilus outer membrane usher protein n=1 Tax=Erwinia endophytica TaxID=1563158 RepID=UPI001265FBE9|nr:fimbria/pilus outer membrane usher protein [Erwinia endophytica]KAB8312788.1 fimbrial biogenesis outer membrane usher protein [Erwinia endophytica]